MKMHCKLLLLLTTGFVTGCTDGESTGQMDLTDTASVLPAEHGVPASDESGVSVVDELVVSVPDEPGVAVSEQNCIDLVSANADWSDNCVISTDQPYSRSTYLLGVQRILWCTEAFDSAHAIAQIADGKYSDSTEEAVRRYQSRHGLLSSGSVDKVTWRQLQQELTLIGAAASEYSAFAIVGARCGEQIHFYQRNTQPHDWKIAVQPGSIELVDFSGLELD